MKTDAITPADLERSVIAVPPLARRSDLTIDGEANRRLIRFLEASGIRSLMYGGNANFYHLPVSEYAQTLDLLVESVTEDTWLLPSVGPDFGKMLDQAQILKSRGFPTAMLLPSTSPHTAQGLAAGIRRFTDRFGRPAVLYIKSEQYLPAETIGQLHAEGRLASIKYAVVRSNPLHDEYLESLIDSIGTDILVSGIGERPAIAHFRHFGLRSMTSGSVCVAPRGTVELLRLLQSGDYERAESVRQRYLPLEDLRDAISPIRVLHDAVSLTEIADMGPMLPLLSNLEGPERARVREAAQTLRIADGS